ncbi:hypothetical protein GCM10011329_07630 [Stakelama pacifica]|nr:hypothetical protein GCM10011329_07630 [Stakelama pacifica]
MLQLNELHHKPEQRDKECRETQRQYYGSYVHRLSPPFDRVVRSKRGVAERRLPGSWSRLLSQQAGLFIAKPDVIARSEATKQSSGSRDALDCFPRLKAGVAMTEMHSSSCPGARPGSQ